MTIQLADVTADNRQAVLDLEVAEDQRRYVSDNAYSLKEADELPESVPRVICQDGEPVGFLMYESLGHDGKPGEYNIYRFMVDQHQQGGGIGRRALELAIAEISARPDARRIIICYVPDNAVAGDFYGSLGFSEVGMSEHGEMIAEIRL